MTGDMMRVTYAELAEARGVSIGAARRMAQRHRWPKQVGNDGLSRVSVPATFLARSEPVDNDVVGDVTPDVANHVAPDVARDTAEMRVLMLDDALAAFASVARDVTNDVAKDVARDVVKDVFATFQEQLDRERERADRAEAQLGELRDKLEGELIEHRRIVSTLTEQLAGRRRPWWQRWK